MSETLTTAVTGLKKIKALREAEAKRREARERPKAEWYRLPKGKEKEGSTLKFLQEIDDESPNYNPDRGLAIVVVEHQAPGPKGYQARGLCTIEVEGRCRACERNQSEEEFGQWRQRTNLYVNVLDGADNTVKILSTNFYGAFANALIDFAEMNDSITDTHFKVAKPGARTEPWSLTENKKASLDESGVELWDLERCAVRHIPYDEQDAYYNRVAEVQVKQESDEEEEQDEAIKW
jgi:hypothetical protein